MRADSGPVVKPPKATKSTGPHTDLQSGGAAGYNLNKAPVSGRTDLQSGGAKGYDLNKKPAVTPLRVTGSNTGHVDVKVHHGPLGAIFHGAGATLLGVASATSPIGLIEGKYSPLRTAKNEIRALVEHPVSTTVNTVKGIRDTIAGVPGGLVSAATTRPDKTIEALLKDVEHRYGQSDVGQVKRFETKGLAPELTDAISAIGAGGATAGRLAGAAARSGRLGAKLEDVATATRPALRTSGGVATAQDLSPNLFRASAQKALDSVRLAKQERAMQGTQAKLDATRAPSHRVIAEANNIKAQGVASTTGRTVEVTPYFDRSAAKAQRVSVARTKSRAVSSLKSEQHRRIDQTARRAINQLDKHERGALYHALALGIRDPATAVRELARRRASIVGMRRVEGIDPATVRKNVDELHTIDQILKDPHAAFTPRLAATVNAMHPESIAIGAADPSLNAAQRLARRYDQQAAHLGIERGRIPHDGSKVVEANHAALKAIDQRIGALHKMLWQRFHGKGTAPAVTATGTDLVHVSRDVARMNRSGRAVDAHLSDEAIHAEIARLQQERLRHAGHIDMGPAGVLHQQESLPDYITRVKAAARDRGLSDKPQYFPSEKHALEHNPDFASRAAGGARAVATAGHYQGINFRRGIQDTSPEVYLTGLARNIKRRHNWNLVADQFNQHTYKDAGLQHRTIGDLKNELSRRGIDPRSVMFWNPGRFRREIAGAEHDPTSALDHVTAAEEHGLEHLKQSLGSALHDPVLTPSTELAASKGWSVVPKAAHDEIMASTHPSGVGGRSWDIFRGKQSRFLLSPNPAWNVFQVLSNAGLGAAAVGPRRLAIGLVKQKRIYDSLLPAERDQIDSLVGQGAGAHGNQVRLGATANNQLINAYRGAKANPVLDRGIFKGKGPSPRALNPMEIGFRADHAQNAHFRRAVLLEHLRKQGSEVTPKAVQAMLHDPVKAEKHAKFVNDWLGDYTSYTHRERTTIARVPMFYGFLRHSLNLMFKTLPRDHPLVLAAAMQLGTLQHDELVKLGLADLPFSEGKYYFTSGGKLMSSDLTRANPALNAVTDIHSPGDLAGLLGPVAEAVLDQAYGKSSFKDKAWATYGKPAPFNPKSSYYNFGDRVRIFGEQLLQGSAVYRAAEKETMFGPQGADSSLLGQRPTKHKRADLVASDRKRVAQDRRNSGDLSSIVFPFIPHPSSDQDIAKLLKNVGKRKASGKISSYGTTQSKGYGGKGGY